MRVVLSGERGAEVSGLRYPNVHVTLSGIDGNAHAIMGTVIAALRRAGVSDAEIEKYKTESKSGDYDNLIQTAMRWVDVS